MSARLLDRTTPVLHHPMARMAAAGILLSTVTAVAIAPSVVAEPIVSNAAASGRTATTPVGAPRVASPAAPILTTLTPAASTTSANAPAASAAAGAGRAAAAGRPSRAITARQALAARQARFAQFTLTSAATKDMRGVEPSLYRGKFFNPKAEEKRLCIVKRESEGEYDVINPTGSYFGAYQVSRSLARGVTFMMAPEHKKLMGTAKAKEVLAKLRDKPMNTWPRYWQDAAFHTIINWDGTLSGAAHWAGGRWHC